MGPILSVSDEDLHSEGQLNTLNTEGNVTGNPGKQDKQCFQEVWQEELKKCKYICILGSFF
jgi:hypothetical protein